MWSPECRRRLCRHIRCKLCSSIGQTFRCPSVTWTPVARVKMYSCMYAICVTNCQLPRISCNMTVQFLVQWALHINIYILSYTYIFINLFVILTPHTYKCIIQQSMLWTVVSNILCSNILAVFIPSNIT